MLNPAFEGLVALEIAGWQWVILVLTLMLAGVVKGATGAGAPIVAVPVLAAAVDVPFAILIMLMPNLLTNIWQAWHFRSQQPERGFLWPYVGAGAVGIVAGTVLLTRLSLDALSIAMGMSVLAYIAFRLMRPDWGLSMDVGRNLAVPAGAAAGLLQGATGLSAPVMLTFLSALRIPRLTFVATISLVFVAFSAIHAATLGVFGLLGWGMLALSVAAIAPIALGIAVGTRLLHAMSARMFNRLVLVLLALVALQIFVEASGLLQNGMPSP